MTNGRALVWAANIAGWPVIQLAIAAMVMRIPQELFAHDGPLYRQRKWEQAGRFYTKWLRVRRWKSMLPDGAPWMGGFTKKRLVSTNDGYLRKFIVETRRAEFAHWWIMACCPVFFLWNPLWACCVMVGYAIASNLPCIVAQRYNRLALTRICEQRRRPWR